MTDFKDIIIAEFKTMISGAQIERVKGWNFKVKAYNKVIEQIGKLDYVYNWRDLKNVEGIGEKTRAKIDEIFATKKLVRAEEIRTKYKLNLLDQLLMIHGIGPATAKKLIDTHKIQSIEELASKKYLLTTQQQSGLDFYMENFAEPIPRFATLVAVPN